MKLLKEWKAIVVGDENPGYFQHCLSTTTHSSGWTSEAYPQYPIDIIIGFHRRIHLRKIEIELSDSKIPSKIFAKIGRSSKHQLSSKHSNSTLDYIRASKAKYFDIHNTVEFVVNNKQEVGEKFCVENHSNFYPFAGDYLWLTLEKPMEDGIKNPRNQINLKKLQIYGSTFECHNYHCKHYCLSSPSSPSSSSDECDSFHPKSFKHRSHTNCSIGRNHCRRMCLRNDNKMEFFPTDVLGSVSENEPLSTVRLLLNKKFKKAIQNGREIEASMCANAIKRIITDESRLSEAHLLLSAAESNKHKCEATLQRQLISDIKKRCLQSIHLDLLLNK